MHLTQQHANKLETVIPWLWIVSRHASVFNDVDTECLFEWNAMVSIDNGDRVDGQYFVWTVKKHECKCDYGEEWHRNLLLSSKRCAAPIQKKDVINQKNQHQAKWKKGETVVAYFHGRLITSEESIFLQG